LALGDEPATALDPFTAGTANGAAATVDASHPVALGREDLAVRPGKRPAPAPFSDIKRMKACASNARAVDRRLKTVSKLSLKSAINLLAARAFWSAAWVRHGQSGLMLHRTRHLFIRQQTSVINAIRAHLVGWAEP
jgi:hypothetical protein